MSTNGRVAWPEAKTFAFTVSDDTDGEARVGGATCDDPDYRTWTPGLRAAEFEIGSHGATPTNTPYGHDPATLANHSGCLESIYWGEHRVSGTSRLAYKLMTSFGRRGMFSGHIEGDPLFWGDIFRSRVRYVRNFTYADTDTLAACPVIPYHDAERPYVRAWCASSEGADAEAFTRCISEASQDRLEEAGGACIMYTHFASGFWRDGAMMASMNGWFVPVSTLLDCLVEQRGPTVLTAGQRGALERRWLRSKIRVGYS